MERKGKWIDLHPDATTTLVLSTSIRHSCMFYLEAYFSLGWRRGYEQGSVHMIGLARRGCLHECAKRGTTN